MSAPFKTGLEYFPHDVDMSIDPRMEYIEAIHGIIGYAVYNKILEKIYHDGYYTKWEDRDLVIFAKKINVDKNTLINVVNDCINEGLFHKRFYEKYQILTSASIQKRYLRCCENCRRKRIVLVSEFLLLEPEIINSLINKDNYIINSIPDLINDVINRVTLKEREKEREIEKEKEKEIKKESKGDNDGIIPSKNKQKNSPRFSFEEWQEHIKFSFDLLLSDLVWLGTMIQRYPKTNIEATIEEARDYWIGREGYDKKKGSKNCNWKTTLQNAFKTNWLKVPKDIHQAIQPKPNPDGLYQEYLTARQAAMEEFKSSLNIDELRSKFREDWLRKDPNYTTDYQDWEARMEPHFQHKLSGYIEDNFSFPSFKSWEKEFRSNAMA